METSTVKSAWVVSSPLSSWQTRDTQINLLQYLSNKRLLNYTVANNSCVYKPYISSLEYSNDSSLVVTVSWLQNTEETQTSEFSINISSSEQSTSLHSIYNEIKWWLTKLLENSNKRSESPLSQDGNKEVSSKSVDPHLSILSRIAHYSRNLREIDDWKDIPKETLSFIQEVFTDIIREAQERGIYNAGHIEQIQKKACEYDINTSDGLQQMIQYMSTYETWNQSVPRDIKGVILNKVAANLHIVNQPLYKEAKKLYKENKEEIQKIVNKLNKEAWADIYAYSSRFKSFYSIANKILRSPDKNGLPTDLLGFRIYVKDKDGSYDKRIQELSTKLLPMLAGNATKLLFANKGMYNVSNIESLLQIVNYQMDDSNPQATERKRSGAKTGANEGYVDAKRCIQLPNGIRIELMFQPSSQENKAGDWFAIHYNLERQKITHAHNRQNVAPSLRSVIEYTDNMIKKIKRSSAQGDSLGFAGIDGLAGKTYDSIQKGIKAYNQLIAAFIYQDIQEGRYIVLDPEGEEETLTCEYIQQLVQKCMCPDTGDETMKCPKIVGANLDNIVRIGAMDPAYYNYTVYQKWKKKGDWLSFAKERREQLETSNKILTFTDLKPLPYWFLKEIKKMLSEQFQS